MAVDRASERRVSADGEEEVANVIAAVVLGVVLLVTILVSVWRRRRRGGDLIGRHERAMSTLRDFYEHPLPGTWHEDEVDAEGAAEHGGDVATVRPSPPRHEYPGPVAPREVPNESPRAAAVRDTSEHATRQSITAVGALATPMREPEHHVGNGRARRGLVVAGATVAVIVVIAAIVGLVSGNEQPHHGAAAPSAPASQPVASSVAAPTTTTGLATTTTAPPASGLAVVDRLGTPTVVVHPPYALTLAASGPCWVQVQDATGHDLFTGTLQGGQTQAVPIPGDATLRMGNSHALAISIDGTTIDTHTLGSVSNLDLSST